jgi:hypothetical protein
MLAPRMRGSNCLADETERTASPLQKQSLTRRAFPPALLLPPLRLRRPGKAEKEEAFVEFTAAVVQDMQEQAAAEAAAVQDEVEDRSLREEFEQL